MKLLGEVRTGKNDFSYWMDKLSSYYIQKTGMNFFSGTLNVHLLDRKYYFPKDCIRLEKEEYGGTVSVSMTKCRIFDRDAYILRTDSDTGKHGCVPEQILEIATNVNLRDPERYAERNRFNLKDGDIVQVEIEAGEIVGV